MTPRGRGSGPRRRPPSGRPDFYELAVERAAEAERPEDDAPPLPSGRGGRRIMLYVVLAGVVVALARGTLGGHGSGAPGSCSHPALALRPQEVRAQGSVQWALSGPKDADVVLAVDTATPPRQDEPGWLAGPLPLRGCEASGVFGAPLAGGTHRVRAFVVSPGPTRVLTQQPLTVDARR